MKKSRLMGAVSACVFIFSSLTLQAEPISGQGTWETTLQPRDLDGDVSTIEAYYDTVLGITWLADANAAGTTMDWATANSWAAGLNINGITGWRLPNTNPIDGTTADDATISYIGTEDRGYNVSAPGTAFAGSTASEMAFMFYNTLGNLGYCDPDTSTVIWCSSRPPGWGLSNTGPFSNLQYGLYWSATEYAPDTTLAWIVGFGLGHQAGYDKATAYDNANSFYAWAVHSEDVGVDINTDSDNDGVPDTADICPGGDDNIDTDGDTVPDFCDDCPLDAANDADEDGVCGYVDNCPLVVNEDQADTDSDGVGNACNDADDNDGDEWSNALDNCPTIFNATQSDADQDGMGDACDSCPLDEYNDADFDGVCGDVDNCPVIANSDQADTPDGDGLGNACDPDDDNDSVGDAADNCPLTYNDTQWDFDGDGAGDVCDDDVDGDNVIDAEDACLGTTPGALVDGTGCSIAQLCPCDNVWKNHGAYVKCVSHTANDFRDAGLIGDTEHGDIVSEAGMSNCGDKK